MPISLIQVIVRAPPVNRYLPRVQRSSRLAPRPSLPLTALPALIGLLPLYGVLLGCSIPVQSTILINVFERQRGAAVGIYNFSRFIGSAIGPMVGGLIVLYYAIDVVFLSLGVMLVVAALAINRYLADPYETKSS